MKIIEKEYKFSIQLKRRSKTDVIVLHHSASSSASADAIHELHLGQGWGGIGYHYLVRKDGSVWRGRAEDVVGAHAKGYNTNSIGICFEGNFEDEIMGEVQRKAGLELLTDIKSRYKGLEIERHRDLVATACPGKNFPALEDLLEEAPAAWADSACDWAVENGLFIGDGKEHYRWSEGITRQEMAVILQRFWSMESDK